MGVVLLVGFLILLFLLFVIPRTNELFLISVREGRALVIRGRVPRALMRDLEDVIGKAEISKATIRAIRAESGARLTVTGTDQFTAQRLRNTFGIHPASKLRQAPPPAPARNLGQRLGWTWLAWLLASRHHRTR